MVCGFCLIHTHYFFTRSYYSSLLVNTMPLCGYGATHIWNLRAFIIWLIPGSPSPPPTCRLESPGTRLVWFDSCGCGCGCGYEMVWVYGYMIVVKGGYDHRRVSGCGWVGREWVW